MLVSGDPLRDLAVPDKPGLPVAVQPIDAIGPGPIPAGCPGGASPATDAAPAVCSFSKPTMGGKSYRIFPGNYPGGLEVTRATVYMEPGIYWIGGGGIEIRSTGGDHGALITKASGDNTGTNPTGGVLIYNTTDAAGGGYGPIHLNGGDGSTLALRPIESGLYEGMVIFVDRDAAAGWRGRHRPQRRGLHAERDRDHLRGERLREVQRKLQHRPVHPGHLLQLRGQWFWRVV